MKILIKNPGKPAIGSLVEQYAALSVIKVKFNHLKNKQLWSLAKN